MTYLNENYTVTDIKEENMFMSFKLYPEMLQIKLLSLIDEVKTIRKVENNAQAIGRYYKRDAGNETLANRHFDVNRATHYHRIFDLRRELRATQLALAVINGKKYRQVERLAYDQPDWNRIERLVEKYAGDWDSRDTKQRFAEWKHEALAGEPPNHMKTAQPGCHRRRLTRWMYVGKQLEQKVLEAAE